MNVYHVWCDLKPGMGDIAFSENVAAYLGRLQADGLIAGWRLMRRKLGLGAPGAGEFHIMIELENLGQLDQAFLSVASRRDPIEQFHHCVNAMVVNATFALYRDFPDAVRHRGEERF